LGALLAVAEADRGVVGDKRESSSLDALDMILRSGKTCVPLTSGQIAGAGTSLT
jgi:hypothetical protein